MPAMSEQLLGQAHQLLGTGRIEAARQLFAQVRDADGLNGLGLCAEAAGDLPTAEAYYRQALASREETEYLNNLAICLQAQGKGPEALAAFERLAELRPEPAVLYNLYLLLQQLRRDWEALDILGRVIALVPRWDQLQFQLLTHARTLASTPASLTRLQELLARQPDHPIWHFVLGVYHDLRGQDEAAGKQYRRALACDPQLFEARRSLLALLHRQGRDREALVEARHLYAAEPSLRSLIELLGSLQMPIPDSQAEICDLRQELEALLDGFLSQPAGKQPFQLQGRPHQLNFFQAYQWGEERPLQQKLARFFTALSPVLPFQPRRHPRPRLGLLSYYLFRHSVTDLLGRALETLLESGCFESYVFCLQPVFADKRDEVTARFRARADHFILLPDYHLQAAGEILPLELDLLIYPDIGMESYSYFMALNRLARHQLVPSRHHRPAPDRLFCFGRGT